jgi:hypothetical protein
MDKLIKYPSPVDNNVTLLGTATYCSVASFSTILISLFIAIFLDVPNQDPISIAPALFDSLLTGIIETILFQSIPFGLTRNSFSKSFQFFAMTVPFAFSHFTSGIVGIVNGLAVGAILSWSYLAWSRSGVIVRIVITSAIHVIHNTVLLIM